MINWRKTIPAPGWENIIVMFRVHFGDVPFPEFHQCSVMIYGHLIDADYNTMEFKAEDIVAWCTRDEMAMSVAGSVGDWTVDLQNRSIENI